MRVYDRMHQVVIMPTLECSCQTGDSLNTYVPC